jgi:hypothetical protein
MPNRPVPAETLRQTIAYVEQAKAEGFTVDEGENSAIEEAARRFKAQVDPTLDRKSFRSRYLVACKKFPDYKPAARPLAAAPAPAAPSWRMPAAVRGVRRVLLTSAQDGTDVHKPFWKNLQAYARHIGAEIIVGGFTYNKSLFEDHSAAASKFSSEVQPHLCHERVDMGPVHFCAEMNTLPTATRPLSGLDTYTKRSWAVFPHAKVQLASAPSLGVGQAKLLMTTGAVTLPNYVKKKAGLKAQFHHIIGATIVEIDKQGRPFCRQINADTKDGSFQDLDTKVAKGKVTTGHRVAGITWGDIHREKLDPTVALHSWGYDIDKDKIVLKDSMLDVLKPQHQFFHDLLDFTARNHHNIADPQHRFRMLSQGTDSVWQEILACVRFIRATQRKWSQSVIVESNHDTALDRWLRTTDFRSDPVNAQFFLRCQLALYDAISRGDRDFNVYQWALRTADARDLAGIDFVPEGGSYIICEEHGGGVECGVHGHEGMNGSRGSPLQFSRFVTKMNTGHTHSASILDSVYTAGVSGKLDMDYNNPALSTWSHSHTVTYDNAKRTIVTMQGERWRA